MTALWHDLKARLRVWYETSMANRVALRSQGVAAFAAQRDVVGRIPPLRIRPPCGAARIGIHRDAHELDLVVAPLAGDDAFDVALVEHGSLLVSDQ